MKLVSFNTLASFGDEKRQDSMIEFVKNTAPDIAYFAEAYRERDDAEIVHDAVHRLELLGYEVTSSPDGDTDRTDGTGFFGIVRPSLGTGEVVSAGTRNGYKATVTIGEKVLRIGGMHFDDRSESSRLHQARHFPDVDVLMGDFNAMHRNSLIAKVLHGIKPITKSFKEIDPDFSITTRRIDQIKSLGQRLVRMADGTLLMALEEKGLRDADPRHQPTIHHVAQIDHIMLANDLEASNFEVHHDVKLSDHKPISVELDEALFPANAGANSQAEPNKDHQDQ